MLWICLAVSMVAGLSVIGAEATALVELKEGWRVGTGDDPGRAAMGFDDSTWREFPMPSRWSADSGLDPHDEVQWWRYSASPAEAGVPGSLGVRFGPSPCGSFRAYANGQWIGTRNLEDAAASTVWAIDEHLLTAGSLVLAVRFEPVSWMCDRQKGLDAPWGGVWLGNLSSLHAAQSAAELSRYRTALWLLLPAAAFLVVGLYQLQLFWRRRQSGGHFWFGLASVVMALWLFFISQSPQWIPTLAPGWTSRAAALTGHLVVPLLMRFLWPFLGRTLDGWAGWYERSQWSLAALMLVLPTSWIAISAPLRGLWVLPFCVGLVLVICPEVWRRHRDAQTIALGVFALVPAFAAEGVLQAGRLGTCQPIPALAFALFTVGLLATLSERHTRMHRELEALRVQLEQMVEDRTEELSHANQRLEAEITERRLAEDAMHMLERAVEQSIDGIAVADLKGNMQFINEAWARMHGYEVFELLGYDLTIFHTPEQMHEQVEELMAKVRSDGAHQAEIEHRRRAGGTFPTWQTATFLQDPDGEPMGYVFIARDLTERKKAEDERRRLEEKLRAAEKLESLGSLAGGVAHDYNNLLTGVLLNVSLALQEVKPESDLGQRLRQIEKSAERAAELTDQLLAYAGEEQQTTLLIQLNDLVQSERPAFDRAMGKAKLEVHLKKGLPAIEGDPGQIRHAISNLLANAADSLDDGEGLIMLRTSVVHAKKSYFEGAVLEPEQTEGRFVFFEVSDTGKGMDEETRSRMFEPFFSTKSSGRGMGLAAVLGIARAHQGAIKVFSQPGRGTTVEVLLPVREDLQSRAGKSGGLQAWEAFGMALVVDDEQLVRDVAAKVLQRQGFEVLTANNGREALDIYEQRQDLIRLVLIDLTMPEMDGETFIREMARFETDPNAPRAKVILMSGYRERSATQGLTSDRLAGFLHKPFRPNELLHKVREVLEREL